MHALRIVVAIAAVAALATACGEDEAGGPDVDAGVDGGGTGEDGGGSGTDGGTDGGGDLVPVSCQGKLYQCGNGLDDDGDGRIDAQDPDCLGPCDNNETGFDPNISGGTSQNCNRVDCYFDQDSGGGNDDCGYDLACDPESPEPDCPYDPGCVQDTQSAVCLDFCGNLTPNGCDCFGCCDLSPDGSGDYRYIGTGTRQGTASCSLAAYAEDPAACAPCTPSTECFEGCGRCQICLNKTEVPEDCFDGGTGDGGTTNPDQCPDGEQPCGLPGQATCEAGFYCITGCCRPAP